MDSTILDAESFKEFLGDPILEIDKDWGQEKHYRIDRKRLEAQEHELVATLRHHHSSFDYAEELQALGYPKTAHALHKRRSGLPNWSETQMGNFAEVMGTEYGKWILGYDTTIVIGKRFNPNVDQSMKGVDILGMRNLDEESELLLGEAKCYRIFERRSVEASYKHLGSLWEMESSRLLAFYKEILRLEGNTEDEAMLDRIFYSSLKKVRQATLILVMNQNKPRTPFEFMDSSPSKPLLPNLIAVHIQVEDLKEWVVRFFQAAD
jgi:hypothetical protein